MNMRFVHAGLLVISFIAALAVFEGLSKTIGGEDWWLKGFCAVIAFGIGIGTYMVWHGAFAAAINPVLFQHRLRGWVTTVVGSVFILAFSAWLTATALGGNEAMRAGYEGVVGESQKALAAVVGNSGLDALESSLTSLATEIESLAQCEFDSGCVSGGRGQGGVRSTLENLAGTVRGHLTSLTAMKNARAEKYDEGKACLAEMRAAVSSAADASGRRQRLAAGVDCLNAAIGELHGNGTVAEIRQAFRSFAESAVIPVSVKTDKQKAAVASILASISKKAEAIADGGLGDDGAVPTPVTMPELNAMQAVIVNWQAIVPALSAAIALDLLPLIILSFQATLMAARRAAPDDVIMDWPVRDLEAALRYLERRPVRSSAMALRRHEEFRADMPGSTPRTWYGPDEDGA